MWTQRPDIHSTPEPTGAEHARSHGVSPSPGQVAHTDYLAKRRRTQPSAESGSCGTALRRAGLAAGSSTDRDDDHDDVVVDERGEASNAPFADVEASARSP